MQRIFELFLNVVVWNLLPQLEKFINKLYNGFVID